MTTYKTAEGRLFIFGEAQGSMIPFVEVGARDIHWITVWKFKLALDRGELRKIWTNTTEIE